MPKATPKRTATQPVPVYQHTLYLDRETTRSVKQLSRGFCDGTCPTGEVSAFLAYVVGEYVEAAARRQKK